MISSEKIKLHDRTFRPLIPAAEIESAIESLAARIASDYAGGEPPVFVAVLNGAFMFASELLKRLDMACRIAFVRLASYDGTCSSGKVSELVGLTTAIEGRRVVVVEDVVDTGESMEYLLGKLSELRPADIEIATLLFKPGAFRKDFEVKYRALEAGNEFVVGFGMDYNELGRNLKDIYVVDDE